jgi:aminopeptidase N
MDDDTVRENIKPFIRTLTAQQLSRLGWQEHSKDSYFDRLLRPTILALSAGADEPTVLKEAAARFKAAKTPEDIHADLRSMIFTTAARHGNQSTFDKLLRFHNQTDMSEERTTLAAALTAFEQPELIDAALGLITTKTVRRQDAMYWVAYSFMNRHARDKTWTWMREHWHWLDKELGSDLSFYRTPIYAARSFSSSDFLKEYRDFFMPKSSPALERSIKQGLEILESNIAWKQRDLEAVRRFLA